MRTKTLALSALLGMIGAGTAMSQSVVYSLNAVGYVTVTMPPGFCMISCQLQTTNNTVAGLLNDASGVYDGCNVYKWVNSGSRYEIDTGDSQGSSYSANGWDNNGTITMNPGEAIWFQNEFTTNVSVTFVGTVPQGTNVVTLNSGFNMASSPVPFSGDLVTNMGLTNYNYYDTVYVWNNPGGGNRGAYTISQSDTQGGSSGYMSQWDTPDPQLQVGQGFWYQNNNGGPQGNLSGPQPVVWTQIFSVNP